MSSGQGYEFAVLQGSPEGLSGQRRLPVASQASSLRRVDDAYQALRRGDLDQDGYEDLVDTDAIYGSDVQRRVRVTFGGPAAISWTRMQNHDDDEAVIFDLNLDGVPDILTSTRLFGPGFRVAYGPLSQDMSWAFSSRRSMSHVMLCDLDNDRIPDLVGVDMNAARDDRGFIVSLRGRDGGETSLDPVAELSIFTECARDNQGDIAIFQDNRTSSPRRLLLGPRSPSGLPAILTQPLTESSRARPDGYWSLLFATNISDRNAQSLVFASYRSLVSTIDVLQFASNRSVLALLQSVAVPDVPRIGM